MGTKHVLFHIMMTLLSVSAVPQATPPPAPTTPTNPQSPTAPQQPTPPQSPPVSSPTITVPTIPLPTATTTIGPPGPSISNPSQSTNLSGPEASNATGTAITSTNAATASSNITGTALPTSNVSLSIVPANQPISFSITVATTQAIAPIPTASVAQAPDKSTVNATSPQIQYQGIWSPVKSSCDPTVTASKCKDPLSVLNYRFKSLKGGAIYLGSSRNADAGVFVVMLDDVQTKIDGFAAAADSSCSFTFSKSDLSAGFHNLSVSFVGRSPQASDASSGAFELNSIQLTSADTSGGTQPNGGKSLVREFSSTFLVGLLGIQLLQWL